MKKIFYVFIALVAIIIVTAGYYLYKQKYNLPSKPISSLPTPVPTGKIAVKTSGGEVLINDITKNTVQSGSYNNNSYYVIRDNTGNYEITYFSQDQGFIITLNSKDLETTRAIAEKDFLEILGINKEEACLLKVTLNVPFGINEQAAGKNYGLSFCPNGKPLPQNQ